ncbi:hypothetical protein JCM5350_005885 [Sporobolomyces pararoseus]
MSLSSGLTLTDLSDYLAPSQACIKPVTYVPDEDSTPTTPLLDKPAAAAATEIVIGDDSGFYERGADGEKGKKLKKAEITLNDCLACSGCITSAESVLVTMQSHEEVYRVLAEQPELTPVVSISPQSVASLAALYDLNLAATMRGLRRFYKQHLGFRLVFDTTFPRALSLLESRLELGERRSHAASSSPATSPPAPHTALEVPTKLTPSTSSTAPLPILSSACPGWICYAEKTHGDLLPFVSAIKSPQSISGVLVKSSLVAGKLGKTGKEVYHVAVMPCYDKKLEASRPDFTTKHIGEDGKEIEVRDVDLVLTTGEVARMLSDKSLSLRSLALEPSSSTSGSSFDGTEELDYFPFSHLTTPPSGTSSGSYVQTAISSLISSLPRSRWSSLSLTTKTIRNEDYIEYTLTQQDSNGEKEVVGKAAKCYGFRNLQNVVRKIGKDAGISVTRGAAGRAPSKASAAVAAANAKRTARLAGANGGGVTGSKGKEKEIEFIEVMACPSGCVNGGGQVAPPKESLRQRKRRRSWGDSGGAEFVGKVDAEGMPDVIEQEKQEIMEGEVKMVMDENEEDRVLSSKDWVKEVEKRYWGDGLREDQARIRTDDFDFDLAGLDPSIVPYLLSQPTREEEALMTNVVERLVEGAREKGQQRLELMRTSYRAVESEEVNGLAVKW